MRFFLQPRREFRQTDYRQLRFRDGRGRGAGAATLMCRRHALRRRVERMGRAYRFTG